MQTDYIDLLLIHEPYSSSLEMYEAMKEAYEDGKIRALGISNFSAARYLNFIQSCGVIPAINQVEAHAFYQQKAFAGRTRTTRHAHGSMEPFAAGKNHFFTNPILQSIGKKVRQDGGSSRPAPPRPARRVVVIPKVRPCRPAETKPRHFRFFLIRRGLAANSVPRRRTQLIRLVRLDAMSS